MVSLKSSPERDSDLDDIVLTAIEEANKSEVNPSESAINKILYITKQNLSEDNSFTDKLKHFWFRHGVLIDNSNLAINNLVRTNAIDVERNGNGDFYTAQDNPELEDSDEVEEFRKAVRDAFNEFNVYEEDRYQKLYEKYAPYQFMVTFRHNAVPLAKKISKERSSRFPYPFGEDIGDLREELRDLLLESESELPRSEEFKDYREIFRKFASTSYYFLDSNPSREQFTYYANVCEDIWNLFAFKIRTIEHDDEIDPEERGWVAEYEKKKMETETNLKMFDETVSDLEVEKEDSSGELWQKISRHA